VRRGREEKRGRGGTSGALFFRGKERRLRKKKNVCHNLGKGEKKSHPVPSRKKEKNGMKREENRPFPIRRGKKKKREGKKENKKKRKKRNRQKEGGLQGQYPDHQQERGKKRRGTYTLHFRGGGRKKKKRVDRRREKKKGGGTAGSSAFSTEKGGAKKGGGERFFCTPSCGEGKEESLLSFQQGGEKCPKEECPCLWKREGGRPRRGGKEGWQKRNRLRRSWWGKKKKKKGKRPSFW